jgi:YHS domain-containing protein
MNKAKRKTTGFGFFLAILAISVAQWGFAGGTPEDSGHGVHVDGDGVAAQGADVVAYYSLDTGESAVEGNQQFSSVWRGATWLFASEENLETFNTDPERYAPQYGGYCAWAMARDKLATIDPDRWDLSDGKLYLNYSTKTRNDWLENQAEDILQANGYWLEWGRKLKNGG